MCRRPGGAERSGLCAEGRGGLQGEGVLQGEASAWCPVPTGWVWPRCPHTTASRPKRSLLPWDPAPQGPCLGTSSSTLYPWGLCPSGGSLPTLSSPASAILGVLAVPNVPATKWFLLPRNPYFSQRSQQCYLSPGFLEVPAPPEGDPCHSRVTATLESLPPLMVLNSDKDPGSGGCQDAKGPPCHGAAPKPSPPSPRR